MPFNISQYKYPRSLGNIAPLSDPSTWPITPNLHLVQVPQGETGWDPEINQNWAILDNAATTLADWNATSGLGVILNKPTIPAAQVNSDWLATSGPAMILNKPAPTPYPPAGVPVSTGTAWGTPISPTIMPFLPANNTFTGSNTFNGSIMMWEQPIQFSDSNNYISGIVGGMLTVSSNTGIQLKSGGVIALSMTSTSAQFSVPLFGDLYLGNQNNYIVNRTSSGGTDGIEIDINQSFVVIPYNSTSVIFSINYSGDAYAATLNAPLTINGDAEFNGKVSLSQIWFDTSLAIYAPGWSSTNPVISFWGNPGDYYYWSTPAIFSGQLFLGDVTDSIITGGNGIKFQFDNFFQVIDDGNVVRFNIAWSPSGYTASFGCPLYLAEDPVASNEAATKNYVDTYTANYLPLTGGTLTGVLNTANNIDINCGGGMTVGTNISVLQNIYCGGGIYCYNTGNAYITLGSGTQIQVGYNDPEGSSGAQFTMGDGGQFLARFGGFTFNRVYGSNIHFMFPQDKYVVLSSGYSGDPAMYLAMNSTHPAVVTSTSWLTLSNPIVSTLAVYADNAAAVAAGLVVGAFYRDGGNPDHICVVH